MPLRTPDLHFLLGARVGRGTIKSPEQWLLVLFLGLGWAGCSPGEDPRARGRVVVEYWEKWTAYEGDAIAAVVEDFNRSQDRIFVRRLTVSKMDQKLILATSGKNPPDVAGLWNTYLPAYVENNALLPLDRWASESGLREENYLPVFWEMCRHRGHLWALPTTPSVTALHWNKKIFREAGLDPEQPPRTLAELERFNETITRKKPDGSLDRIGHMPQEPGWWMRDFNRWFGGKVWDGESRLLLDSEPNRRFFAWLESYPRRFGGPAMDRLRGGFGNFASPENPFFTGKVAMVMHGVWLDNFIRNYAPPDFDYGAAPFPTDEANPAFPVSVAEADILVIPAGSRHPREAMEFIRYVQSPPAMEKLCLLMKKFTPLRDVSPAFLRNHPHPYLRVFLQLARSPRTVPILNLPSFNEYSNDIEANVNEVLRGSLTGEEGRTRLQGRQQKALDDKLARWRRVAAGRESTWCRELAETP